MISLALVSSHKRVSIIPTVVNSCAFKSQCPFFFFCLFFFLPALPQWYVCKKEEVFTNQQLFKQERSSSLDQEDTKPPEIKEEQNEICCTSQEGEQLALKQETDTVLLTSTYKKSDHSQDESLYSITDQTHSGGEEKLLSYVLIESSAASGTNTDHQLLSRNSHVPERQHEDGDKHASSGSANCTEPKPKKNRRYNLSEIPHNTDRGKKTFPCDICGKDFMLKFKLYEYQRNNTSEKMYGSSHSKKPCNYNTYKNVVWSIVMPSR